MHHPVRRKMHLHLVLLLMLYHETSSLTINFNSSKYNDTDEFDNNIIDFDSEYDLKLDKKYGDLEFNKANRYTIVKQKDNKTKTEGTKENVFDTTTELNVLPLELLSTTEDELITLIESTTEQDLTVIPLSSTSKAFDVKTDDFSLPTSTESKLTSTENIFGDTTEFLDKNNEEITTDDYKLYRDSHKSGNNTNKGEFNRNSTTIALNENIQNTSIAQHKNVTDEDHEKTKLSTKTNITEFVNKNPNQTSHFNETKEESVPIFTELDVDDEEVPEDYYDAKDVIPTKPPANDALSVIFGLAGSVVESVAERVVPKGIFDLFKRMQKQSSDLEAERLRSREENGGIGQIGRGILKSISDTISKPLTALMGGVKDIGSLDTDRGFVSSAASGANVASSAGDAFKNRVQAIYPGTLWCGDGHSAQARSSDLGLFFFTDTCCRQHDACKIYIRAGETKYGLTNTGLFTRSHCSCDAQFRDCLRKTNSLVSSQIGLTYFNVLGPQCFRKAHPIVRCLRKTRITGQKCEEYELDYTKSKMWQWFDNETF